MTYETRMITAIMISMILLAGGIVPYSSANNDHDDEIEECEPPGIFEVMYSGPDNANVEIYKLKKHAKNSQKMLYEFPENFNNGDYIKINSKEHMDRDEVKSKTTYKITHGNDKKYITIPTSCKVPLAIGDEYQDDDVTLTVMYGGDHDDIPVIHDSYRHDKGDKPQLCLGDNAHYIDFTEMPYDTDGNLLEHGAEKSQISSYLTNNFPISEYKVDPPSDSGDASLYDARINDPQDPDLYDPRPHNDEIRNQLIVQESGSPRPDDDASGGTHEITFATPVDLESMRIIDIEDNESDESFVKGYFADGGSVVVGIPKTGNNNQKLLDAELKPEFGELKNLDKIEIHLDGSGAVTNFCIKEVATPDISITLTKVIDNSEAGHNDTVILENQVDDFDLSINGDIVDSGVEQIYDTAGSYEFSEADIDNYVATVSGDNCPLTTYPETIDLALGDVVDCTITNTFVPPPTILMKKALTNDNNGDGEPSDWTVTFVDVGPDGELGTADDGEAIEPQPFTNVVGMEESSGEFTFAFPAAGNYQLAEELTGDAEDSYTTVLIAGDTSCPSMENETFSLEEGEHITCTIYNDDNFTPIEPGESDGFFFARNAVQMEISGGSVDETASLHGCENVPPGVERPCVTTDGGGILIVDPQFEEQGGNLAAIAYAVLPETGTSAILCSGTLGIGSFSFPGAGIVKGFIIDCLFGDDGTFNIPYALIETMLAAVEGDGVDNDGDGAIDEDPYNDIDDDSDGLIDEDP